MAFVAPGKHAFTRRSFLAAGFASAVAACSTEVSAPSADAPSPSPADTPAPTATPSPRPEPTPTPSPLEPPAAALPGNPFTLGVASGDPSPDASILWTRLAPDPLNGGGMPDEPVQVLWEVAPDDGFTTLVATGLAESDPTLAHSLHVDASGLDPDAWYFYRFRVGDYTSPTGRTRTLPRADTAPGGLTIAFSSCQHYETGHYAAHRHLAQEDADLMVWLGDYIYEGGATSNPFDSSTGTPRLHDGTEATDLAGYRNRYALYKSDADLQASHAARPWLVTWDDHEVQNNYAGDHNQTGQDATLFRARRAAAYQAWYEHMPVRLAPPRGPDYEIHRSVAWGDLAHIWILDDRQYRDPQPTDGEQIPILERSNLPLRTLGPTALDPDHTMLGPAQEAWLLDGMTNSGATWSVLAQQVMMHGLNALPAQDPPLVVNDTWDGYHGNRRRILETLHDADVTNLVVLTGDFHSATVGDLKPDPFARASPVVGTEFMATSISSAFPDVPDGTTDLLALFNPQIKYFDTHKGYAVSRITRDRWTTTYLALDDVTDPASSISVAAEFEVTAGTPGAVDVS